MAKARVAHAIDFEGSSIRLFPGLSWLTLQKRRHLKPLLLLLQKEEISYRWGFPFALLAFRNGLTAVLHAYEELPSFCTSLNIAAPDIAEWKLEDPCPGMAASWRKETSQ